VGEQQYRLAAAVVLAHRETVIIPTLAPTGKVVIMEPR